MSANENAGFCTREIEGDRRKFLKGGYVIIRHSFCVGKGQTPECGHFRCSRVITSFYVILRWILYIVESHLFHGNMDISLLL